MTKDEVLKLAIEALEGVLDDSPKVLDASISGGLYEVVQCRDAITAIKEALAQPEQTSGNILMDAYKAMQAMKVEGPLHVVCQCDKCKAQPAPVQEPVQDSTCNETLRGQGKAYPRTCKKCGLGPCIGKPKFDTTPPAALVQNFINKELLEALERAVSEQFGDVPRLAPLSGWIINAQKVIRKAREQ
jgi:hypothetical protein